MSSRGRSPRKTGNIPNEPRQGFNPIRGCWVLLDDFHGFHPWLFMGGPFGAVGIESNGKREHILSRGDRLEDRFMNDDDRKLFLATLAHACEKTGCLVHTAAEVA